MSDAELPKPTLAELRRRHVDDGEPLGRDTEAALRADPRAGARAIVEAVEKRRHAHRAEGQRQRKMLRFEQDLWQAGVVRIAGVDEAGVSPLAGPLVAGAVILPVGCHLPGVDDSKKLDATERERLVVDVKAQAVAWGVGVVTAAEVDQLNPYRAGLLAMRRAVLALSIAPEHLLIDARKLPDLGLPQRAIVRGDSLSLSIAAASIVAKTARDAMMEALDAEHPGWGFAKHKGYGVPEHLEALDRLGASPVHRRSFAPVKKALGILPEQMGLLLDG